MARFSIGDVDKPTHATIVKGFHTYTREAISPAGKISVIIKKNGITDKQIIKERNVTHIQVC